MTGSPAALFVPDGDSLVPTELARGPWTPDALHGGPVAAVVTRATERAVPADDGLRLVRLTLELIRPVAAAPLSVTGHVSRPGRKVQLVETVVTQSGSEVARGRAVRIRVDDGTGALEATTPEDPAPPPPSEGTAATAEVATHRAFHADGVDIRWVTGRLDRPGPATAWFRLRVPVVAGEQPTPAQRAMAVADFGNGVSSELEFGSYLFINPDLTVYLLRDPVGEWVCLDARTRFGPPGTGLAESALWDERGRMGRALQSLFVERVR
jgi:hypothetical protein